MIAASFELWTDHIPDPELVGIQFERLLNLWCRLILRRRSFHTFGELFCEALGDECEDGCGTSADLSRENGEFDGVVTGFEPFERLLLAWREGGERVGPFVAGEEGDEGGVARAGLAAHSRRYDGVEHLAPATEIIVRHPASQGEEVIVQQGSVVENAADGFHFAIGWFVRDANDEPRQRLVAATEWALDVVTDTNGIAQRIGQRIGKRQIERSIENDLDILSGLGLIRGHNGALRMKVSATTTHVAV